MNRIAKVTVAGKEYPLNASVRAIEIFDERYDGVENIQKAIRGGDGDEQIRTGKVLAEVCFILSVLMEQGARYTKLQSGEEITVPPYDDLCVLVQASDLGAMQVSIYAAMNGGMGTTLEVESTEKNGEATQG